MRNILQARLFTAARSSVSRCRSVLAVAGAGVLAAGLVTVTFAGPASAATGYVYLATSSTYDMYTAALSSGKEMGVYPYGTDHDEWNVIDEGHWSAAGVSGEGYELQAQGSNLCVGDTSNAGTTGQGGASGENSPTLRACGANGTIWVAVKNGDGYFLYDRYLLNNGGFTDILAVYGPHPNAVVDMINTNFSNGGWFERWQFPGA